MKTLLFEVRTVLKDNDLKYEIKVIDYDTDELVKTHHRKITTLNAVKIGDKVADSYVAKGYQVFDIKEVNHG